MNADVCTHLSFSLHGGLDYALSYQYLNRRDYAGWWYGYAGDGTYKQGFFQVTHDSEGNPAHFYCTNQDDPQEGWVFDLEKGKGVRLPEKKRMGRAVRDILDSVQYELITQWIPFDETKVLFTLEMDRLDEMYPVLLHSGNELFIHNSDNADLDTLMYISTRWNLKFVIEPAEEFDLEEDFA